MTAPYTRAQREHAAFATRDTYLTATPAGPAHSSGPLGQPRPRTSSHDRRLAKIVAAGVLLLGVVTWVELTIGSSSPRDAVSRYFLGLQVEDYEGAWEVVCQENQGGLLGRSEFIHGMAAARPPDDRVDVRVGDPRWDDTYGGHLVPVRASDSVETKYATVIVVEQDDEYRVCGSF